MELRPPWRRAKVAVVELYGSIGGAVRTQQYVPALKALREDDHVRAVVLDIDSPGGSATASDYIYTEVQKLAAVKPVVAFVRGIGASGAYFIAMGAGHIIATRSSLVGSIGVITIRPVAEELLARIGVQVAVAKTGPLKGAGLPFTPVTEEEAQHQQEMVDRFFDHFVRVVAEGRNVSEERVREWATGEVFWAMDAQEKGLIDAIGDLESATTHAARLAGITDEHVSRVRPRRQPLVQRLTGQASHAFARAVALEVERALTARVEYRYRRDR